MSKMTFIPLAFSTVHNSGFNLNYSVRKSCVYLFIIIPCSADERNGGSFPGERDEDGGNETRFSAISSYSMDLFLFKHPGRPYLL